MSAGDGEVGLLAGGGCARRGKRQRSDDQFAFSVGSNSELKSKAEVRS